MNVKFILHSKANKKGENPIYLRVTNGGKKMHLRTKLKVLPTNWNKKSGKAKTSNAFPLGSEMNIQLAQIEETALGVYNRFLSENRKQPDLKFLKQSIESKLFGSKNPDVKYDLFIYYEKFNSGLPGSLNAFGRPVSMGYIASHKQTLLKLRAFIDASEYTNEFDTLDMKFYYAFIEFLNSLEYSTNYVGKQIKNLKTVLNRATIEGINKSLKYKDFKEITEDTVKLALNEDDLDALYKLNLVQNKKLELVRDIFLVGCWTGLRYSDLSSFSSKAKVNGDIVSIKTQKTQSYVSVPLHPITKEILSKYPNGFKTPSEPIFNRKLKDLGKMIPELAITMKTELTKGGKLIIEEHPKHALLQSHTARRSFATNMFKMGIPVETIMAITGHRKTSTFYKYVQLPPDYHAKKIANIFNSKDL